jgi:hypothetical protein
MALPLPSRPRTGPDPCMVARSARSLNRLGETPCSLYRRKHLADLATMRRKLSLQTLSNSLGRPLSLVSMELLGHGGPPGQDWPMGREKRGVGAGYSPCGAPWLGSPLGRRFIASRLWTCVRSPAGNSGASGWLAGPARSTEPLTAGADSGEVWALHLSLPMPARYECSSCGLSFSIGSYHGAGGTWNNALYCRECGVTVRLQQSAEQFLAGQKAEEARVFEFVGPVAPRTVVIEPGGEPPQVTCACGATGPFGREGPITDQIPAGLENGNSVLIKHSADGKPLPRGPWVQPTGTCPRCKKPTLVLAGQWMT